MSKFFSEETLMKILFILVLVIFSFAQEDSKKMAQIYSASSELKSPPALLGDLSAKQTDGSANIRPSH